MTRAAIWAAVSTTQQATEDKASLEKQIADALALIDQRGWTHVHTFLVPGHSRDYSDFHILREDALKKGIPAFAELQELCARRAFDVLITADGTRFARRQSLHARIVEMVILEAGAAIYSFADGGEISAENMEMFAAMSGYASRMENKTRMKRISAGKLNNTRRGLTTNGRLPFTHKIVRDAFGRQIGVVPDETRRSYVDAAVDLLLSGVSWQDMDVQLHARFPDMPHVFPHRLFHSPAFWGHMAHGVYRGKTMRTGRWSYDKNIAPPPEVVMTYDAHAPYLTGIQAELVKAELRRRSEMRGRRRPANTRMFSGLLVCDYCKNNLRFVYLGNRRPVYQCASKYRHYVANGMRCDQTRQISQKAVQAFFNEALDAIRAGDTGALLPQETADTARLERLQAELAAQEAKLGRMIHAQAERPELAAYYDREIAALADNLASLKRQVAETQARHTASQQHSAQRAASMLEQWTNEDFWQLEERVINQILHMLCGQTRFLVRDRQIVGDWSANG